MTGSIPPPLSPGTGWPWTEAVAVARNLPLSALPTISVVTPSYNQARYLEATLRSVLLQGYPKLEYIVMDGGSSDGSVSIIQHYAPWLTSWTSGPDGGQSAAINAGFARSTGQILAWLNSDDHYLPETLWTIAQAAIEHPDTDAFAGGSERLDQSGKSLGIFMPPGLTHAEVVRWRQQHLPQPSCFFRRCAWERSGPLDEGLYHLMDYDLWLRMTRGSRFLRLERVLSREIRHDQAKNLAHPAEGLVALWLIKHRHDPAVAEAEMVEHVREFMRIQRQAQALTSSLPYRIARPLIKLFSR